MTTATPSTAFAFRRSPPRPSRAPLAPSLAVGAARDAYLAENGFDLAGYTADTFEVEVFGRTFTATNSADRKWAIPLHDLHHVATGYGTDLVGEAEIGAWELVGGCSTLIVYWLNATAVMIGLLIAPRRTLAAFRDAHRAKTLYRQPHDLEQVLGLTVGEL